MSRLEEALGSEPPKFSELLIGAGVLVYAEREYIRDASAAHRGYYSPTELDLAYEGYKDDLLAAGVITAAMLTPPGKGHHYRDPGGRNVRIARVVVERDGHFCRYFTVRRRMQIGELHRWPGGAEGLAAFDRWLAWYRAWCVLGAPEAPALEKPAFAMPSRAGLRLVVDNTREVTP